MPNPTPASDAIKWKARALIAEAKVKRLDGALRELLADEQNLAGADSEDGDAALTFKKSIRRARRALGLHGAGARHDTALIEDAS